MRCLFAIVASAFCLLTNGVHAAVTGPPPNIIYLLADDLGWADVGWHEDIRINAISNSGTIRMNGWSLVINGHIIANDQAK